MVIQDLNHALITLLKIILGLLKPNKGCLNVNGIDIHSKKQLSNWFDKIAYVPQEIYLINDSVKKNILFGSKYLNINNYYLIFIIRFLL